MKIKYRVTRVKTAEEIVKAFLNCIEVTGGVAKLRNGFVAPVADPEWIDLGELYLEACKTMKQKPVYGAAG